MAPSGQHTPLSYPLAEFFVRLKADDLPSSVVDDARWRLVDTIGVALAGSRMNYAQAVKDVAMEMGGRPDSSVIGFPHRLPAPLAGFVNAAFAHGPDFDDTHSVAMAHISCLAVPAALAMAEKTAATGAAMLTAMVAGAEVGLRIGAAAPHRFHQRGYHATGVVGPFTAAAAGGLLIGLDAIELGNALGLAGSQAAGLLEGLHDGSWVKRLHPAWAVQSGLTAALLAERGFVGTREVFEGEWGLFAVLLHGDEGPIDLDTIVADLGSHWLLPGTTYKPYSNGAWNHSSMDAVAAILKAHRLTSEDIKRIDAHVPPQCIPIVCEPREAKIHPTTAYHMKFSLPYSVAILAVLGRAGVDDYTGEVLANPQVADLAGRVFCHEDPDMPPLNFPARVVLETNDGRKFAHAVTAQRGGPGNPMSADDHRAKFRSNAMASLGQDQTDALLSAIEDMAEAPNVDGVVQLLSPMRPAPAAERTQGD